MLSNMVDLASFGESAWSALRAARERGDFDQLLPFLEQPELPARFKAASLSLLRDLIRDGRITEPKRKTGRPSRRKKTATESAREKFEKRLADLDLYRAVDDVKRIMRVRRKRYGQKYRIQKEAIAIAAERRGVDEEQIVNQLKMSRSDPRKL